MPLNNADVSLPKTVTRFFGNVDYGIETLREGSIAFIHNMRLNDPFDPYFFLETEFRNRGDFLKWVRRRQPSKLRWVKNNVTYEGFAAGFQRVRDNFDERRRNTYLFSTSAESQGMHPKDNLYLWGHYGRGHRGIALEFNAANLGSDVLAHCDPEGSLGLTVSDLWVKVEYKTKVAPLSHEAYLDFVLSGPPNDDQENQGLTGIRNFLDQTLKTKHTVWQMESEWRLLWNNDFGRDVYRCPISNLSVAGIYLGLRIDTKAKNSLVSAVKSRMPNVPIFQAYKAERNLALTWSKIT